MENYTKFKQLLESLENDYFFYSHDLNGKYLYISPSIEKVLGYSVEEARGGIVKHMTDSEFNKTTIDTLKKSASGEKQKTFELEVYTKSREIRVIQITESPLYNENNELVSIEGIAHDITEKKKSEQIIQAQNAELIQQKEDLQKTLENLQSTQSQLIHSEKLGALGHLIAGIAHEINTPIGAIQASVENITTSLDSSVNNIFKLFTGLTKKELKIFLVIMGMIESKRAPLTSKEKREAKKIIRAKLTEANIENYISISELILYLKLDNKIDKIIPLLNTDDPEFILKAIKDIYSVRKNSENIKMAVEKASKVVLALKKFSHKDQGGEKEKTNLIENIETVLTLHYNQLKQGIELVQDFEEVPFIYCFPDELIQVWSNLISNAMYAMNYHGELTISVKNRGDKIQVSIKDNGAGIPEEIKNRIFEPFFTTKKAGEGTGIGLDLVKKIIEKHDAQIDLESTVGEGATFIITLPIN